MTVALIISRKDARELGLKYYFPGTPCFRGHIDRRLVSNGYCMSCHALTKRENDAKFYVRHADRIKKRQHDLRFVDPEKTKANDRKRYAENREERVQRSRDRYAQHREEDSERKKKFALDNPELTKARARASYQRHKAARLIDAKNRKMARRGVPGKITAQQIADLLIKQKGRCAICFCKLKKGKTHRDHITPTSKGGTNDIANIQMACATCNIRKNDKDPAVFARQMGRLL